MADLDYICDHILRIQFGKNMGGTQNAISGFLNKLASASSSAIISALLDPEIRGELDARQANSSVKMRNVHA